MPRKLDCFYEYSVSLIENGYDLVEDQLSYKNFLRLWATDFRWLKVQRKKTIKSKCAVCEDLAVSKLK